MNGDETTLATAHAEGIFRRGPSILSEIGRLKLRTKRSVNSDIVGQYKTAFRGKGLLFSELREYQPGDDIKQIHWKASARAGKIFVKSYEEERELRLMLALDMSSSLNFGYEKSNFQKALEFAAAVTVLAERLRDSIGLCLFSDAVHEFLPPARSRYNFNRMVQLLSADRPFAPSTDLNCVLSQLNERFHKHTVLFIISDFYSKRPFFNQLKSLSQRHDVVLVCVADAIELRLPRIGVLELQDPETSRRLTIDSSDPAAAAQLLAYQNKRLSTVSGMAVQAGADFVAVRDNPIRSFVELMRNRVRRLR